MEGIMNIIKIKNRTPELIASLLPIWEASVRATHLFLSNKEIENIKTYKNPLFSEEYDILYLYGLTYANCPHRIIREVFRNE